MTTISNALQAVRVRIARAAQQCGRPTEAVRLLAVSKTFGAASIRAAYAAGQRAFGESYAQEAVAKIAELHDLPIEWHFIGPIQSNKTKLIAAHFDWVHSVDRTKIAQRLSEQRSESLPALQICLQVNVSGEASKSGVTPDALPALARAVATLPKIQLRGLMTIPEPSTDTMRQRQQFALLRTLMARLNTDGFAMDTLSMGMSDDLEAAIAEGATLVRVGTAIFGTRLKPGNGKWETGDA